MSAINRDSTPKQASMIWMHGLGASGDDMRGLVSEMQISDLPLKHIYLEAPVIPVSINQGMPMPAWYDIQAGGIGLREDEAGIFQSEHLVKQAIQAECDKGVAACDIYLAGFSQGGAMALHTGLRYEDALGGIIALSTYLPMGLSHNKQLPATNRHTPIFFASGTQDPIVLPVWSEASHQHLKQLGFEAMEWHTYPMPHSVCVQEMADLARWIRARF